MNTTLRCIFFLLCFVSHAFAFDWQTDVNSGSFTSESHPSDSNNVRKEGDNVGYIQNGSWIAFSNFDFGGGVEYLWIEGATAGAGGTVEFRLGSESGTLIGSVAITTTGDSNTYKPFALKISAPVTGVQNLYLKFTGGTGTLFNLAKFRFQRLAPDYKPAEPIAEWDSPVLAADMKSILAYSTESHPTDGNNIRREFGRLAYIRNGNWISYKDFDFGTEANYFSVLGGASGAGGNVEVRLGSSNGTLLGTVAVTTTGGNDNFRTFSNPLTQTVTGVNDLYLRFTGSGTYLFNLGSFRLSNTGSVAKSCGRSVAADQLVQESDPGSTPVVINNGELGSLTNGSWVSYGSFDFGTDSDLITIEAATPGKGGVVEVRTGSETGPVVATVNVTYTGSWTHFRPYSSTLSPKLSGTQNLYLKFVDPYGTGGDLFNLKSFAVGKKPSKPAVPAEGGVYVYPSVPGLAPSPYYTYSVQKVSALNNAQKQMATNWMNPFAWFTDCPEPGSDRSLANTAYYDEYIGGWSHTYCNFELDRNTPIVVKITRNTVSGAPSGPIFMANVHPAHKVMSCEIIDGDVYVTMKEPTLVTVDIDGQLDNRDAPRAVPDVWNSSTAPYKSRQKGSHAVSIFANPVIQDKPALNDPNVRVIEPGQSLPLPDDQAWTTLYFKPGIHNLSQDANGQERAWVQGDRYPIISGKNYYIPGDAVVYGNFYGRDSSNENIRFFGHGTLSGYKIPHFQDYSGPAGPDGNAQYYHMINIAKAMNCNSQGITIADPPEHTLYFLNNQPSHIVPNSMRWYKSISWRVNNDTGSVNGVMEDCFFRHQDDGIYFGSGALVRRCAYWSDVNGKAFRGSFVMRDKVPEVTTMVPREIVFEDCDIIYARGVFGFTGNSFGIIGNSDNATNSLYSDGTPNTGQHIVFRNFRVTDPRPLRTLFGFNFSSTDPAFVGMAGLRFENVEYRHPQTWGWPNYLEAYQGGIKNWYMDRVFINGQTLDSALLADRSVFETSNVSEMVFGDSSVSTSTFNLQANTTGGSVSFDPPGGVYPLGTVVTVTAVPYAGHVFSGWGGDLSGSTNPTTITMTSNKSITANINTPALARTGWVATASSSNGSPGNAIDGDIGTRWATGASQTNGQWFRVDMGSAQSFTQIVLDCSGAAGDYPRGYQVHVSNDGSNWGSPVATGTGSVVTTITFPAQTARYIRVTQTGSVSGIWWSIHEFNVYEAAFTLNENSANGSVIFDPPGATYLAGTVVTVTAVPDPGYEFTDWGGDLAGTTNPTTVTMTTNKSVMANFSAQVATYTLTATSPNGAVTFNPPGPTYPINTVVTVTAVPDSGYVFTGWGGDLSGSVNPTTFIMNADKSITANIGSPVLSRTGWVASASSANGSPANAIDGNITTRWSTGAKQVNGQWFQVDMGDAKTFNRIVLDSGSSGNDYPRGYQVFVSNDGVNWGSPVAIGAGAGGVTMITFATQTARYIRVTQTGSDSFYWWSIYEFNVYGPAYTLTETSPNGAVTFDPPGPTYLAGTVVTVTAVPDLTYAFASWGGDLSGMMNPTTVTITGNTSVLANFTPTTYTMTTTATNGSILSDPPGGVHPPGTSVTLTPTPAPGYQFSSWSGDLTGNENPATLTMSGNKSVTANFWQPTQVTIDTTGGTTVLNYDDPGNTYIGNGTLLVSNDGSGSVSLGTDGGTNPTVYAMSGGLITIDTGVTLVNGGWSKGIWTNNKANMQVNGTLDVSNGNPVIVNSLNGAGAIILSDVSSSRATELHVGVLGGSGTFSGTIQEPHPAGSFVRIVKQGGGTQTFDNLANQKPGEIVINSGVVNLSTATDLAFGANISGAGDLRKSGAGLLTLSGIVTHSGDTTVEDGVLSITQPNFVITSTLTIGLVGASPAVLHLPNSAIHIIDQLIIDGVVQAGNGAVFDSLNSAGAITGLGKIQVGSAPTGYAAWVLSHGVMGGPTDDDDNDGLTNFEEYAFGLLPKNGSSANPFSIPFSAVAGTFSYTRRNSALTPPLSYTVWYSTSLGEGNWLKDTGTIEGTRVSDGEVETVPVTISPALLVHPKLFIQIRAE